MGRQEITIPEKIKLVYHWNDDKITRIFDLKLNDTINNLVNLNKFDGETTSNILNIILDEIEKSFNVLNNGLSELFKTFNAMNDFKFLLISVVFNDKKYSSLFLNIDNIQIGLEIEAM